MHLEGEEEDEKSFHLQSQSITVRVGFVYLPKFLFRIPWEKRLGFPLVNQKSIKKKKKLIKSRASHASQINVHYYRVKERVAVRSRGLWGESYLRTRYGSLQWRGKVLKGGFYNRCLGLSFLFPEKKSFRFNFNFLEFFLWMSSSWVRNQVRKRKN